MRRIGISGRVVTLGWLFIAAPLACFAANKALLVGVTKYDNLPEKHHLRGPANDVVLFQDMLLDLGFDQESIVTLSETSGKPGLRPVYANIKRELDRLVREASTSDQIVILMAGHGSRQPADDDPTDREPDGLDEIFLPADSMLYNELVANVPNAIPDDYIDQVLTQIVDKGAFVWLIADFCHSGTAHRGIGTYQRFRKLPPADLGIDPGVLEAAQRKASATTRSAAPERESSWSDTRGRVSARATPGSMVVMSASQADEQTPETILPKNGDTVYGLFTYTLVETIQRASSNFSYRELANQIYLSYRSKPTFGIPTPSVEGDGLDRFILGDEEAIGPDYILLTQRRPRGRWKMDAGMLHGFHPGTILKVYPPAGAPNASESLGHVRIITADVLTSEVMPIAYAGVRAPGRRDLREGCRCEPVFVDYGTQSLRITMQQRSGNGEIESLGKEWEFKIHPNVANALLELELFRKGFIEYVDSIERADWVVLSEPEARRVVLMPAGEAGEVEPEGPDAITQRRFYRSFSREGVNDLEDTLSRIARAQSLLNLARDSGRGPVHPAGPQVEVELRIHLGDGDVEGSPVEFATPEDRKLHVGQRVSFWATNSGQQASDVSLLFIDSSFGIMPLPTSSTRVLPGETVRTGTFTVSADPLGPEALVAIAAEAARGQPLDLSYLAQPALRATRSSDITARSPVESLLESALFPDAPRTRGLPAAASRTFSIKSIPWTTVP